MQNPPVGNILVVTHNGLPINAVLGNSDEAYTCMINSMLWLFDQNYRILF